MKGRVRIMGLVGAGSMLAMTAFASDDAANFQRELSLARRAGMPTTPGEMKRNVPASQNAGLLYRKLNQSLNGRAPDGLMIDSGAILGRIRPTPQQIAKARAELAERKELVALIHQAAQRPQCDLQHDWSQGASMLFPEFARMRMAARWLTAESGLMLWNGKPLDAVQNASLGFRLASHAESDPIIIAYLVAVAMDAITLRAMENILYHAGDKAEVCDAVGKAIEVGWRPRSVAHAMRGELVMGLQTAKTVRRDGLASLRALSEGGGNASAPHTMTPQEKALLDSMVDYSSAVAVSTWRQMHAAGDLPYGQAHALFSKLDASITNTRDPKVALAAILLPSDTTPTPRSRGIAKAGIVRSAAAVLGWKARHGKLPDRLEQAIQPVPTDPFDLQPLRYRREGTGFVLYSVGETGKFGGNAPDMKQYNREAVFRWPMPEMLKQPPPALASPKGGN